VALADHGGFGRYCDSFATCLANVQAAALMHELGTTSASCTRRQQRDDLNFEPNYLSTMNYLYEFHGAGDAPLDFSSAVLPQLDEGNLSRTTSIGGGVTQRGCRRPPSTSHRSAISAWWPGGEAAVVGRCDQAAQPCRSRSTSTDQAARSPVR